MGAPADIFARGRFGADTGPLYTRLARLLRQAVAEGSLNAGDVIPGERDLAEMLQVSRVTVRKALAGLAAEGVIVQRRGSGTYIAQPAQRLEQPLSRLTSFTEDMESRGLKAGATWLGKSTGLPTPEEVLALGISPAQHVSRLNRLRTANGMPMAIELAVVPLSFLPDPQIAEGSLYAALASLGVRPVRALQRLRAMALTAETAQLLGLSEGCPALFIERISYLRDGRIVEFTRSHYRGDSYDFVAELTISPERP